MKSLKHFLLTICLLLGVVALAGCEELNDDDDLYDVLVGRVWSGDMGFYQDGNSSLPLDSSVYFGVDGFGYDELHYANNGQYLDKLNIQWELRGYNTIAINYGNVDPPRELRSVRIRRGVLEATLYIDGRYYNHVTLYMK